jgi:hypothetical protein
VVIGKWRFLLKNDILFEALRRVHEMHSTAKSVNPAMMLNAVQTSKGDSSYSLGVACRFKSEAEDLWDVFCDIYDTSRSKKELSDQQMDICRSQLQKFWRRVKKNRSEYESVASWYIKIMDAE